MNIKTEFILVHSQEGLLDIDNVLILKYISLFVIFVKLKNKLLDLF